MNRQKRFIQELTELLHKYDAELEAETDDDGRPYINVWAYSVFNDAGILVDDRISVKIKSITGTQRHIISDEM